MISFRVLLGIGQGIFTPAYFAFVGGAFGKRRGFVLGSLAGLFTVGAAINPLTTRFAFNAAGKVWQAPFVAYGVFGLLLALVVAWFGRSKVYETGHVRRHEVLTTLPRSARPAAASSSWRMSRRRRTTMWRSSSVCSMGGNVDPAFGVHHFGPQAIE